jgi:hypothetical protein
MACARNPAIRWMVGAVALMLGAVLYVPWLRTLFQLGPSDAHLLVAAMLAGARPVLAAGLLVPRATRREAPVAA